MLENAKKKGSFQVMANLLSIFAIEAWIMYDLWYPFQKKYLMTSYVLF